MKASVYIATSLDGFIAREDGDIGWLTGGGEEVSQEDQSQNEDYGYGVFMDSVDALVMGRNSYEKVLSFGGWAYGDKPVVVLSRRPIEIPERLSKTVEAMSGAPEEVVARLSERGMKHLYIDGGVTIQRFLRAGLIQRLIITRIPVLIGAGIPLFGSLDGDIKLRHVQTQSYPSGLVQSEYEIIEPLTPETLG